MADRANLNIVQEYWLDAWQRSILTLDILRERGNIFITRAAEHAPHVLGFAFDVILDGRALPRPVNYILVSVTPPEGTVIDPAKPPYVVIDPRAGHGPGIGGMKQESEIGVALAAGHACYFVGFLPKPMPKQTIADVCAAEAAFLQTVAARHPEAESKPVVVGNCQAGWQIMMTAAICPDLFGPILLAGSPLSYWAGVRGRNPMRYLGGTLGGTWLTALAGDLGNGTFDGANLVANFESLNPANTYWEKPYNLYSKADTEAVRFLDFETWWGNPVTLNAGEMQWIADNLFVGNKLTSGDILTADGTRVDLRNIRSPIIVLCSRGDNITPPQQALGWVTDLYDHEDEIIANGQTIVYTLHQTIGHLGIFVSSKVATKEHAEFASCMEMIDLLPPGLYEAVITEIDENTANPGLISGQHLFQLEARTLDDIRALGANNDEDQRRFATAARVSEINTGLYRTFAQPAVRAMAGEQSAKLLAETHPHRMRFAAFSDRNPFMAPLKPLADAIRADRRPVSPDNPLLTIEKVAATWISTCWESYRLARDAMTEAMFLGTYGSPALQAMVGLAAEETPVPKHPDRAREAIAVAWRAELDKKFEVGALVEAVIRSIMYVRRPQRSVDERGFAVLQAVRRMQPANHRLSFGELKTLFREQYLLLYLDEERAARAIPLLLPNDPEQRSQGMRVVEEVLGASGDLPPEGTERIARLRQFFAATRPSD